MLTPERILIKEYLLESIKAATFIYLKLLLSELNFPSGDAYMLT